MKKYILGAILSLGLLITPVAQVQAAGLSSTQISAIIQLLQAFGADQSVINNVQASLAGTAPTPSVSNAKPTGSIDSITSGGTTSCGLIGGWAFDSDSPATATGIHVYVDNAAGVRVGYDSGVTNAVRTDVNAAYGITGAHGYNYQIPNLTAGNYTALVYAIGVDRAGNQVGSENTLLNTNAVPKAFSCTASTAVVAPTFTTAPYFSPNSISSIGLTSLYWSAKNADHCSITYSNGASPLNSASIWGPLQFNGANYPNGITLTATVTCYDSPGSAGQSVAGAATLSVTAATAVVAPTINSFTASPTSIISGQSTTLSWTSTGADTTYNSCVLDANGTVGLGNKPANGSFGVSPTVTTTYNLLCSKFNPITNSNLHSSISSVTVTVTAASVPVPTVTSSFSPSTISPTGSTVYSYSSTNATHCLATHPNGTGTWDNVTPNASFSDTYTAAQFPNGLTTTITCYNAAGQSAVSTQTLTVLPAPTVTSSFSPSTISSTGSSVYSYSSANTTHCVATHPDGTGTWDNVTPNASFSSTYTASQFPNGLITIITCYNAAGQSAVSTQTLTVTNQTASAYDAFNSAKNSETSSPQGTGNTSSFHYVWNNNLQIGSSYTADVSALQTALTREGVYTGEASGGFYNQTFSAVKAFQQKYNIDSTGFVGSDTRAKLNALY